MIEKLNISPTNAFQFQKNCPIPTLLPNNKNLRILMHLLLPADGQTHNIVLFRHLKLLVSFNRQEVPRSISRICRNCFHTSSCKEIYQRRIKRSFEFEVATTEMPHEESKIFNFRNYQSNGFVHFLFFFILNP